MPTLTCSASIPRPPPECLIFRFLVGADAATNPRHTTLCRQGTEEALFGNGVTLKVTLTWNANAAKLYLNDAMVKQFTYTTPTPNWSAASNFDLGAYEYLTIRRVQRLRRHHR